MQSQSGNLHRASLPSTENKSGGILYLSLCVLVLYNDASLSNLKTFSLCQKYLNFCEVK